MKTKLIRFLLVLFGTMFSLSSSASDDHTVIYMSPGQVKTIYNDKGASGYNETGGSNWRWILDQQFALTILEETLDYCKVRCEDGIQDYGGVAMLWFKWDTLLFGTCYVRYEIRYQAPPALEVCASPGGGEVPMGTKVTLTAKAGGNIVDDVEIYYTFDGSNPNRFYSPKYTSPITINESCTLKAQAYRWYHSSPILTATYNVKAPVPETEKHKISAGQNHSMFIKADGSLWACGYNYYGQLGVGTSGREADRNTLGLVMDGVASVSAGETHTMILKTDGSLWACGTNFCGQLGDGTTDNCSTPKQVMDNVAAVSAGNDYTMILKTDGSLWACGKNVSGQLGDDTTTDRNTPVKVMDDVASVSAGYYHTMIIKTDGSLWGCGNNNRGALGDGTWTNSNIPVKVTDGVASVSAGEQYTMIVKADGSLWACGRNLYGRLGDDISTDRNKPVKVMDNVAKVSAGFDHTMILKTDGSLWACGRNNVGQLGDGTTTNCSTPKKVMEDIASVSAGENHTIIQKNDGTFWTCGSNRFGKLGDGTETYRHLPVQVVFALPKLLLSASPSGGEVPTGTIVNLIAKVAGNIIDDADIYYTTNLTSPTTSSPKYTSSGISIDKDCLLMAVAYKDGYEKSDILKEHYSVPKIEPSSIDVSPSSKTIYVGDSFKCNYTLTPSNATTTVTWSSDNDNIATVTSDGEVTGVSSGTVKIYATTSNGKNDCCEVVVKDSPSPNPGWTETDISTLDNVIYIGAVEASAGGQLNLSLKMKNSAPIRGFQFDLYLPAGVTVAKNNKGRILASLSHNRLEEDDEHTMTVAEQEDGSYRFLCGSQYDETFTGNDGEIATLTVNIVADMADGDYPITLKDIKLTETDISKYYETSEVVSKLTVVSYKTGDINGDGKVDVSDYIGVANYILGSTPEGFVKKAADVDGSGTVDVSDYIGIANIILTGSIYGGGKARAMDAPRRSNTDLGALDNVIFVSSLSVDPGTTVPLSICMKNSASIRGFQFDLYLPEGVTAAKNNKGRILASLSKGRLPDDDEHTLTCAEQEDGAIRFLCGSQYDETFTGNDGEIATLTVNIPADMAAGDYPIVLRNIKLTETDISKYYETDYVESTLTIEGSVTPDDPELEAPEGWTSLISNGNFAGDNVANFLSKEAPAVIPTPVVIKPGAGKNGSRGITVQSVGNLAHGWDTQFFIRFNESLPEGTKLHVEFDYKADKNVSSYTQSQTEPGNYIYWAAIGTVNFTPEWQHYIAEVTVENEMSDMQTIAFNLGEEKSATLYSFDNFGIWMQKPAPVTDWVNILTNSDLEGTDVSSFFSKEAPSIDILPSSIFDGVGVDGSRGIKVTSIAGASQDWDTQFWIYLPCTLPEGTKYLAEFDYKASREASADTETHGEPGRYIHWSMIGSPNFTTKWQHYKKEGSINALQASTIYDDLMRSIAFNLSKDKENDVTFYFDNIKFHVEKAFYETGLFETTVVDRTANGIYNLHGQKVDKPVKGLYILNGRKVLMK